MTWNGKDLIERGVKPGPHMGNILKELRMHVTVDDELLNQIIQRNVPVQPMHIPLQQVLRLIYFCHKVTHRRRQIMLL